MPNPIWNIPWPAKTHMSAFKSVNLLFTDLITPMEKIVKPVTIKATIILIHITSLLQQLLDGHAQIIRDLLNLPDPGFTFVPFTDRTI